MSHRAHSQAQTQQKTLIGSSPRNSLLQRTCTCGQHTIAGGECSTCRSQQSTLQRSQSAPGRASTSLQENVSADNTSSGIASHFDRDFSQIPLSLRDTAGDTAPTQRKENSTGLPDTLKAGAERLSGLSLDDVRVHYNSSKPADVNALAYTQGTDIHMGPGQEQHLAHEAWHVVQQMQGRVSPTLQMEGVAINDDERLEQEADVMGAKSVNGGKEAHQLPTCCCSSCMSQKANMQRVKREIPMKNGNTRESGWNNAPIQGCWLCHDPECRAGEKCGLFPPNAGSMDVGPYNEMRREGSQGGSRQWEHPISGAALRGAGMGGYYNTSVVVGIPWETHQQGRFGVGGGITSTGGSSVAREWSAHQAELITNGHAADAVWLAIVDAVNAAQVNRQLSEDWAHAYWRVIDGYVDDEILTEGEGENLKRECLQLVLERLQHRRF